MAFVFVTKKISSLSYEAISFQYEYPVQTLIIHRTREWRLLRHAPRFEVWPVREYTLVIYELDMPFHLLLVRMTRNLLSMGLNKHRFLIAFSGF
jgi:hypothetical protein